MDPRLAETVETLAEAALLGDCSIVVEELAAEPADRPPLLLAERTARRPLSPASMIKVPIAAALYARAAAGALDAAAERTVQASNMTANDAASPLQPGYTCSLQELMHLAIARSDNVATNELIDAIGRENANTWLQQMGLKDTFIRRKLSGADPLIVDPGSLGRNAHPARDAATLFARLATGSTPGHEAIRRALDAQVWNDKLSVGWESGDRFAHKTGETSEVSHDGGVLTTSAGRIYIIVVYTPLPAGPAADERLARFARSLRAYL